MVGAAIGIIIVSLVAAVMIVNGAYRVFMRMMGSDVMFYSVKTKMIAIFVVFAVIAGTLAKLFGISN